METGLSVLFCRTKRGWTGMMPHPLLLSLAFTILCSSAVAAQGICSRFRPVPGRCDLTGTPVEQAKCLLRPVKKFGNIGAPLQELPDPFDTLVGQPTSI